MKPLFWIASSRKDLKDFPVSVRRIMGFALFQAQTSGMHLDAKPLKGFGGAGVLEVVENSEGNAFRTVYTVKFAGAVYVLHAFQKKSTKGIKTPKADIELIQKRLKTAKDHYEQWIATQKKDQASGQKS